MPSPREARAGAAHIELYVNNNRLVRGLKRAQRRLRRFKDQIKLELSSVANYDSATAAIGSIVLPARSLLGFRLEAESLDGGALTFINDAKSKKAVITIRRRASTAIYTRRRPRQRLSHEAAPIPRPGPAAAAAHA